MCVGRTRYTSLVHFQGAGPGKSLPSLSGPAPLHTTRPLTALAFKTPLTQTVPSLAEGALMTG